jgi:CheY-like chemotaxis protein
VTILIVEDDENKGDQLQRFLREIYPERGMHLVKSLQSAVRYVRSQKPSLILLDMTLPNYDASPDEPGGGTTHSFGGREFLRQMDRFDIQIPVIVFTQFETFGKSSQQTDLRELDSQLRLEHKDVYRGAVYYHASIGSWKDQLKQMICQILNDHPSEKQ